MAHTSSASRQRPQVSQRTMIVELTSDPFYGCQGCGTVVERSWPQGQYFVPPGWTATVNPLRPLVEIWCASCTTVRRQQEEECQ